MTTLVFATMFLAAGMGLIGFVLKADAGRPSPLTSMAPVMSPVPGF